MNKHLSQELPIRSKMEMMEDIAQAVHYLHSGEKKMCEIALDDLKSRSLYLDSQIQQDVMIFCEQVQFQYSYDPWHKVTLEIQRAADKLIEDLGFTNQRK